MKNSWVMVVFEIEEFESLVRRIDKTKQEFTEDANLERELILERIKNIFLEAVFEEINGFKIDNE